MPLPLAFYKSINTLKFKINKLNYVRSINTYAGHANTLYKYHVSNVN